MKKQYSGALHNTPGWEEGSFYKILKFKTGEIILCEMESNIKSIATEVYIDMIRPCIRIPTSNESVGSDVLEENYIFAPWIGESSSTNFIIPIEMVFTIADMSEKQVVQYKAYWSNVESRKRIYKKQIDEHKRNIAIMALLMSVSETGTVQILPDETATPIPEGEVPVVAAPVVAAPAIPYKDFVIEIPPTIKPDDNETEDDEEELNG